MHIAGDTNIFLRPERREVPEWEIFRRWRAAEFRPRECREALERVIAAHGLPDDWFAPAEIERGGVAALPALLFAPGASGGPWSWRVDAAGRSREFEATLGADDVATAAEVIGSLARCRGPAELRARWNGVLEDEVLELLGAAYTRDAPAGRWPEIDGPGIYRREHASLVIRSRTTTVLTDPQVYYGHWTTNFGRYPAEGALGEVDAVLLTHGHEDHWHLPAILRYAGERSRVVVPEVPAANLLARDVFADALACAGCRAEAPPWYSCVRVGDIEIDVLPFYGEQPTRTGPAQDPRLRNWGNCYRVNCPDFSALLLVDSGVDPAGDMVDVVARSVRERGPVDVVLSCFSSFPEVINAGLPHYLLTLPFERLEAVHRERLAGRWQSMTGGTVGVARAAAAAHARYVMPYAHGFRGIGRDPRGESGLETEAAEVAEVEALLRAAGCQAAAVRWSPGDVARFRGGALELAPATPPG